MPVRQADRAAWERTDWLSMAFQDSGTRLNPRRQGHGKGAGKQHLLPLLGIPASHRRRRRSRPRRLRGGVRQQLGRSGAGTEYVLGEQLAADTCGK
jgi:hypothetical protein